MKKILSTVLILILSLSCFMMAGVSAEESTFTPSEEPIIYFEVPEDWAEISYNKVFCHIWAYGSNAPLANWQSKKEACTATDTEGLYSYNISKAGTLEEGTIYCVIFSLNTGQETYTTLMSTECYGDTLYCDDTIYENPIDSNKRSRAAFWKNHDPAEFGPLMQFTSLGNLVGTCMAPGATTESLIIDFFTNGTFENALEFSDKTPDEILIGLATALGITNEELADIIATLPSSGDESTPDEILLGDSNEDGTVNVKDATAIQKQVAGFDITIDMAAADADQSGTVNIKDATAIQKYVAGITVPTPIGELFTLAA